MASRPALVERHSVRHALALTRPQVGVPVASNSRFSVRVLGSTTPTTATTPPRDHHHVDDSAVGSVDEEAPDPGPSALVTTFLWKGSGVSVALAGSFDDWRKHPMEYVPSLRLFILVVEVPPGEYFYRFVVDGRWRLAEDATDIGIDAFGEQSHVLRLEDGAAPPGLDVLAATTAAAAAVERAAAENGMVEKAGVGGIPTSRSTARASVVSISAATVRRAAATAAAVAAVEAAADNAGDDGNGAGASVDRQSFDDLPSDDEAMPDDYFQHPPAPPLTLNSDAGDGGSGGGGVGATGTGSGGQGGGALGGSPARRGRDAGCAGGLPPPPPRPPAPATGVPSRASVVRPVRPPERRRDAPAPVTLPPRREPPAQSSSSVSQPTTSPISATGAGANGEVGEDEGSAEALHVVRDYDEDDAASLDLQHDVYEAIKLGAEASNATAPTAAERARAARAAAAAGGRVGGGGGGGVGAGGRPPGGPRAPRPGRLERWMGRLFGGRCGGRGRRHRQPGNGRGGGGDDHGGSVGDRGGAGGAGGIGGGGGGHGTLGSPEAVRLAQAREAARIRARLAERSAAGAPGSPPPAVHFPTEPGFRPMAGAGVPVRSADAVIDPGARSQFLAQVEENASQRQAVGAALLARGQADAALALFSLAVRLREKNGLKYSERNAGAHGEVARAFAALGDAANEEKHLRAAVRVWTVGHLRGAGARLGDLRLRLGVVLDRGGAWLDADVEYEAALQCYARGRYTGANVGVARENRAALAAKVAAAGGREAVAAAGRENVPPPPVVGVGGGNAQGGKVRPGLGGGLVPEEPTRLSTIGRTYVGGAPPLQQQGTVAAISDGSAYGGGDDGGGNSGTEGGSSDTDDSGGRPPAATAAALPSRQPPPPPPPVAVAPPPPPPPPPPSVTQLSRLSSVDRGHVRRAPPPPPARGVSPSPPRPPPSDKGVETDDDSGAVQHEYQPPAPTSDDLSTIEEMARGWQADGRAALLRGDYDGALDAYTLAIYARKRHGPWASVANAECHVDTARALFASGRLPETVGTLRDAVEILETPSLATASAATVGGAGGGSTGVSDPRRRADGVSLLRGETRGSLAVVLDKLRRYSEAEGEHVRGLQDLAAAGVPEGGAAWRKAWRKLEANLAAQGRGGDGAAEAAVWGDRGRKVESVVLKR